MKETVTGFLEKTGLRKPRPPGTRPAGMPKNVWRRVQDLEYHDWMVRQGAADALGKIRHESAIPRLIKALEDKDRNVGKEVVQALYSTGGKLKEKKVEDLHAKALLQALKLIQPHFRENETPDVLEKALKAALDKKITEKNAKLYVKQLRALGRHLK
ncbi:MAG: HEAT repeat domain-containing protein [Candidatus Micrarchaeota archaeon]|nr:HEAT repeat domain-containing protein [Candidatus Micrarchaeota archaeon]